MNDIEYYKRILFDTKNYIETYFNIKSKDRKIIPFILNPIQNDYFQNRSYIKEPGKGQRDIILKGRQHGFTTLKTAEYLHDCLINEGVSSVIVGHDDDAMQRVLENARLMYNSIPAQSRPTLKYDNKDEMYFPEMNSRMYISTYRKLKLRSQTVNNLLMTEVAFWEARDVGELVSGMSESVPVDGNICYESTPHGTGGHFWEQVKAVQRKESIYKLFIYPWFVNKEYRIDKSKWEMLPEKINLANNKLDSNEKYMMEKWGLNIEQVMWCRYKMFSLGDMRTNAQGIKISRRFATEYSCSFTQSGMTVFDSSYLVPVTRYTKFRPGHKYIHGGDTAEGIEGGDYSVLYTIDFETGEVVNKIRGLWKPDEFAMRVHRIGIEYGGLVGIENNNTGHAVLLKLVDLWEEENTKKEVPYKIYSEKKRYGWSTNVLSRKTMFVEGEEALRDGSIKLAKEDTEGIEELMACQYTIKLREEAPAGMHDDSIFALLICWQMSKYYDLYFNKNKSSINVKIY